MSSTSRTSERLYEKYGWVLLLLSTVPLLLTGLGSILAVSAQEEFNIPGTNWQDLLSTNPLIARWVQGLYRSSGIGLLGFAIYAMMVTALPYRKGER